MLKRRIDNGESSDEVLPKTIIKIVKKIEELSYARAIWAVVLLAWNVYRVTTAKD